MTALRKSNPSIVDDAIVAPEAVAEPTVKLASADTAAVISPALHLQADLASRLNAQDLPDMDAREKYPFKWTLIGVVAVSLTAWIVIARLIF